MSEEEKRIVEYIKDFREYMEKDKEAIAYFTLGIDKEIFIQLVESAARKNIKNNKKIELSLSQFEDIKRRTQNDFIIQRNNTSNTTVKERIIIDKRNNYKIK